MTSPKQITTIFVSVALIVFLGFSVYANTINGKFMLDDYTLIQRNVYIQNPVYISYLFSQDIGAGSGFRQGFYRPIFMLSLMMDFSLWRLDVRGYHFTTILLHILAALSIYWLISILFGNLFISLGTAVFFMVHPIQAEDVAYITGRSDSMALLFILLCLIFYIKQYNSNKISAYIFVLLNYILALLSKENSIILPALVLLYHYIFNKKIKPGRFFPILLITFSYVFLRTNIIKSSPIQIAFLGSTLERLPGVFVAISNYARMLLLPFNLHTFYSTKLFQFSHPEVILGILISIGLLIYAFRKRDTNRLISFSIFWFFLSLLPVSNIYPATQYMAMRYLYVPGVGFFLIMSNSLNYVYRLKKTKAFITFFIITLGAFYAFLTIRLNANFKDPITYYKWNLRYVSDSPLLYNNIGNAYMAIDKKEEAMASYKQAIAIDPNYVLSYNNLANVYFIINRKEEAITLYQRAIEIDPYYADAYNNLGLIYSFMNKYVEAISLFMRVIEINPHYADAYFNLGRTQCSINRSEDAIDSYKKAIEINPYYADAYTNLGNIYYSIGKVEEAIALNRKAIEINPYLAEAYNNLGNAYKAINKIEDAVAAYKKAIEINPNFAEAYNNLGSAYKALNKIEDAVAACKKAIEIEPNLTDAYNNLGLIYSFMNKYVEAISLFMRAIEINPHYAEAYNNLGSTQYSIGRSEDAISSYKKAIEINPNYAQAFHDLSVICFYNKQYKLAIEYCDKSVALGFPDPLLLKSLKAYRDPQ